MEKSRTMTMTKGLSSVGPTAWINGTVMSVQESEQLVRKSEKDCLKSRMKDPLPGLRQVLADLSNNEARTYCRKVRQVAYLLRNTLIDVNTEIRSLTRSKEALEKAKDQIDIDTKKNKISYEIRQKRPDREKVTDNADALLRAEYRHLQDLKKSVEIQQNLIRNHLLTLDEVRRRLTAVSQERSRTLELVADALPRSKGAQQTDEYGGDDILSPDPLGPYTPEADDALDKARAAIDRAKEIKRSADENLARVDEAQKAAIQAVNNCLSQKIRETTMLKNQLTNAVQENRSATNKAQKVFNDTELAWMELRGPVNSRDLSVQEKLDRPIVKVFQRHPGTNLPEAQEMVKGTGELLTSLQCTGQNIGMLKMAEMRLQEDKNNKMAALNVDKQVALIRRKKVIE